MVLENCLRGMIKAAILIILLGACSAEPNGVEIRETGTRPPPLFAVTGEVSQTNDGQTARSTICLGVKESSLFTPGDDAYTLSSHLATNSRLLVDSYEMPLDITTNFVGTLNYVYDSDGNLIGSRGDFAHLCYDIDSVKKGFHIATFFTSTTSGTEYSYSFEIIIK